MGVGVLIKHFPARQAGSFYSEPQRTVCVPLYGGILLNQRLLEIRVLLCRKGRWVNYLTLQRFWSGSGTDSHRAWGAGGGMLAWLAGGQPLEQEALALDPHPQPTPCPSHFGTT